MSFGALQGGSQAITHPLRDTASCRRGPSKFDPKVARSYLALLRDTLGPVVKPIYKDISQFSLSLSLSKYTPYLGGREKHARGTFFWSPPVTAERDRLNRTIGLAGGCIFIHVVMLLGVIVMKITTGFPSAFWGVVLSNLVGMVMCGWLWRDSKTNLRELEGEE